MDQLIEFSFWNHNLVQAMEIDQHDSTNLILSVETALLSLNLTSLNYKVVLGSVSIPGYEEGAGNDARFAGISGFVQLNLSYIVLNDRKNSIIRLVSKNTWKSHHLIGIRDAYGDSDGSFAFASIMHPQAIKKLSSTILYVTQPFKGSLRQLNLSSQMVSTVIKEDVQSVVLNARFNTLYAIGRHFYEHSINTSDTKVMRLWKRIIKGGSLSAARFEEVPDMLIVEKTNKLIIANYILNQLLMVDIPSRYIVPICFIYTNVETEVRDCSVAEPSSLYQRDERTIYVGANNRIYVLNCEFHI